MEPEQDVQVVEPVQDVQVVEPVDLQVDEPQPQVMALSSTTPMLAAAATTLTTQDLNNIWLWSNAARLQNYGGTMFKWFADEYLQASGSDAKLITLYGQAKQANTNAANANTNANAAKSNAAAAKTSADNAVTKANQAYTECQSVGAAVGTVYNKVVGIERAVQTLQQSGTTGTVELTDEQYDALQQSLATNLLALTIALGVLALILGAIVGIAITMHWRAGRG